MFKMRAMSSPHPLVVATTAQLVLFPIGTAATNWKLYPRALQRHKLNATT